MSGDPPTQASVVIIGGGSIGCNIAYHLNLLGWTDVVVVERDKLTSGTTWHAAGEIVPRSARRRVGVRALHLRARSDR